MNHEEKSQEKAKSNIGRNLLFLVGLLLLVILPFVPWLSRGFNQGSLAKAVRDSRGRAEYDKYLLETGDYSKVTTDTAKTMIGDLFGEPFVRKLTSITLTGELDRLIFKKAAGLRHIETLDLNDSNLEDSHLRLLANCKTLRKLSCNNTKITNAGVNEIAGLTELVSLGLEGTAIDDAAMESVGKLTGLKRLYMMNTPVTDQGVMKLKDLPNLLGIGLEGTSVTDQALETIVTMKQLVNVRLSDTAISGVGAAKLAQLPKLQELNLANTQLKTDDLGWLSECNELEVLDLMGSQVTDDIGDVLTKMPKLTSVNLRKTTISDQAAKAISKQLGITVQWDAGDTELTQ